MSGPVHENLRRGFTLVEVLVGSAIFLIVSIAVYGSFTSLFRLANGSQARTLAVELAAEQFEIVRNMPYASVGLTTGIPLGILPQNQTLTRGGIDFGVKLTVRNINLSTSSVEASDKLVEVEVNCPNCHDYQPVILTGQVSPANLQTAKNGGAVVTKVFDGKGNPVEDAIVFLQSVATSTVTNTDVTDNNGILNVIGVPPGNNMYKMRVSKAGYSTEETYPLGAVGNPNPTKPNVTVQDQNVTQVSFAIDKLSSLHFSSVTPLCVPVPDIDFLITGAKQIGLNLPKHYGTYSTDSSGLLDINGMEWDTYAIAPIDLAYDITGINPYSPLTLNPDNSQNVQLVVVPRNPNTLMVSVQDSGNDLPVSAATVRLRGGSYDKTFTTGRGYVGQSDWSAGDSQVMFTNPSKYFSDNGKVDISLSNTISLKDIFGSYDTMATATLESSTFDTGTTSNFYTFTWEPISQPILTGDKSAKFQFATNLTSTSTVWNYLGPDGTPDTYYMSPDSPIDPGHNGSRYARYKSYMTTESATVTPRISSVQFSFASGCVPPGQVVFQGLSAGSYTLTVTKAGYTTYNDTINVVAAWQQKTVIIGP